MHHEGDNFLSHSTDFCHPAESIPLKSGCVIADQSTVRRFDFSRQITPCFSNETIPVPTHLPGSAGYRILQYLYVYIMYSWLLAMIMKIFYILIDRLPSCIRKYPRSKVNTMERLSPTICCCFHHAEIPYHRSLSDVKQVYFAC